MATSALSTRITTGPRMNAALTLVILLPGLIPRASRRLTKPCPPAISITMALCPVAISAAEILAVLRSCEARGVHETANRLRSKIGAVFRYAIATTRADNDPTGALKGALTRPTVPARPAITRKEPLGALLRAIDGFDGQPATCAALKLVAVLEFGQT